MSGKPYILHVDDDEDYREILRDELEMLSFSGKVSAVRDGVEALAFLRKEGSYAEAPTPGVILLDLKMPRMDGHAVMKEMQADSALRDIPVVILTNSVLESDRARAVSLGAVHYLTKLAPLAQLEAAIARCVSKN